MKEQRDKKPVDRQQLEKEYETLGIRDRFIFSKVMTDKNLCIQVLRCLTGNDIEDIGDITAEKYFQITNDSKGVRYDVYVEDEDDNAYDAEMQNYTYQAKKELMLRNRYYQSIIDNRMMESGMEYQELKDSYVIFICTFDPFGKGRRRYTFFNVCEEDKELYADDGRTILIFNTGGCLGELSEEAKEFLDYVCVDDMGNLLRPDYLSQHLQTVLKRNNLKHIRYHDLRHSCASLLLANGVSLKEIQDWLGHSDFSTTANIYSHLEYGAKVKSANKIAENLSLEEKTKDG